MSQKPFHNIIISNFLEDFNNGSHYFVLADVLKINILRFVKIKSDIFSRKINTNQQVLFSKLTDKSFPWN